MTRQSAHETPKLKKGPKKLPQFKTFEEAVEFFDTHDTAPYLDQMESGPDTLALDRKLKARILRRARARLKKKLLTLRLETRQIEDARRIATAKGMGYLTLMRVWIQEGIRRDRRKVG